MADRFENLEEQLERFIENTRQLGIIVSDFQPQGQNALNQKLQTMVQGMQEIDKMKSQMQDVHVPLEVFDEDTCSHMGLSQGHCVRYIDQGKNPNLYTKHCLEKALGKNEQVKGKIDAFKKFKALLILELSEVFPKEIANYRAMRGDDRPT